jgi:hypothetical protein
VIFFPVDPMLNKVVNDISVPLTACDFKEDRHYMLTTSDSQIQAAAGFSVALWLVFTEITRDTEIKTLQVHWYFLPKHHFL